MFEQDKSVSMRLSASWLSQNLSAVEVDGVRRMAIANKFLVSIASKDTGTNEVGYREISCRDTNHAHLVFQVRFLHVSNRLVLAVASEKGLQIYEGDGSTLLYWYALPASKAQPGATGSSAARGKGAVEHRFARGLCVIEPLLFCATSTGRILAFRIPASGSDITREIDFSASKLAISALCSTSKSVCCADQSGTIQVLQLTTEPAKLHEDQLIDDEQTVVTAMEVWQDEFLLTSRSNGRIRIYDVTNLNTLAVINAHARHINALDLEPDAGLVLTGSDDSFVRLWQLKRANRGPFTVDMLYQSRVKDQQIVGVQFFHGTHPSAAGQSFCISCSDSDELRFFTKKA